MAHATCTFAFVLNIAAPYRCPSHGHSCTEIVFCEGCRGRLVQGRDEYDYSDGDAFVYQPGSQHYIESHHPGRHICFGIVGADAETLRPGVVSAENLRPFFHHFGEQVQVSGSGRSTRLDLLAGYLTASLQEMDSYPSANPASYAQRAAEIMRRDISTNLSVVDVAARIYLSPDHLREVFRKEFGTSPLQYLLEQRIERACALLLTTDMPVSEIGREVGLFSPHNFSRVFRRFRGVPPATYRATNKGLPIFLEDSASG